MLDRQVPISATNTHTTVTASLLVKACACADQTHTEEGETLLLFTDLLGEPNKRPKHLENQLEVHHGHGLAKPSDIESFSYASSSAPRCSYQPIFSSLSSSESLHSCLQRDLTVAL